MTTAPTTGPLVVREVSSYRVTELRTALSVLDGRAPDVAADIREQLARVTAHLDAVAEFRGRMKFGTSLTHHAEGVMTWLIAQGWTPPNGVLLLDSIRTDEPQETP